MTSFMKFRLPLLAAILSGAGARLPAQQVIEPYTFKPVTITAGGYIPGIVAHPTEPDLLYLRTDIGGVYRWNKAETRWKPLLDFHSPSEYNLNGPESIALDPTDPSRLYIAAGMYAYSGCCAFLVSDDQGKTFKTYSSPFEMAANNDGRAAGERLAVNPFKPKELMMGTRFNGLWVSKDRAQTWQQVASFPVQNSTDGYGVNWVVFDPKTSGTVYVGSYTSATVYVSKDDGTTWTAVPNQPKAWPANYNATGQKPPAPERALIGADGDLYVTFDDLPGPNVINRGLVEKYDPSTLAWTNITPPIDAPFQGGPAGGFVGLTQDASHPGTIAVSTSDRWYPVDTVYLSHNGGGTWLNLGAITSSAGDDGPPYGNYYFNTSVFAPTPYLTFGDTNYPNSPNPSAKFGWWISGLQIDPANPDHLLYGTGATLYGAHDVSQAVSGNSPTWEVEGNGVEETAVLALISPKTGAHLLSGLGDIGGFVHTDFKVSPQQGMYTNPVANSVGSLDWAGNVPAVIVRTQSPTATSTTACNYGALSKDGGTTWAPFPSCAQGVSGNGNGGTATVDASGTTVMWTPGGSAAVAHFSTNGGTTWTAVSGLPAGAIAYADKAVAQTFYAYAGGSFYSAKVNTAQATAVFQAVATGLPTVAGCYGSGCGVVDVNFAKAGDLWLPLGSNGLYHSINGGATWEHLANVPYANSVAVGAKAPFTGQEAVFLYGQAGTNGAMAVYISDTNGEQWGRINDDAHQYGGPTLIQADPRVYGRVYLGMNGRGIIYGDGLIATLLNK
ncbi:MAG: WD40/YVTN/BNR-like repeat-containing protein [Janthinobacterium lividum]